MNTKPPNRRRFQIVVTIIACLVLMTAGIALMPMVQSFRSQQSPTMQIKYEPRYERDASGFLTVLDFVRPWKPEASLTEISDAWKGVGPHAIEEIDRALAQTGKWTEQDLISLRYGKAALLNFEGEPKKAYQTLEEARTVIEMSPVAERERYNVVYLQGLAALRQGENENCILCRGESSCIIPIAAAAIHTNPQGSRLAVRHFTEYLDRFPDDLAVRWLLNLAHMTLGEHPDRVDPRFLVPLDNFRESEFDIGRFRDVGHIVGVNRFNQAGGAILEDFNNDGLLDIATTTFNPTESMSLLYNTGKGTFEDGTQTAGLTSQLGGLNCVQTDYNNDGYQDIYVIRGAWMKYPMRPSLLRNNKDGTFTDVTSEAGLLHPVNSISASWADYDNDGWLDLFVCCERQASRLYHNLADGTFEDVAQTAGVSGRSESCKGVAWIDYDNDGFQDLFLNYFSGKDGAQMYHNNRNGTFQDVTTSLGIQGPVNGFSCWAWDYDNDGWLDLFATSYDLTLQDVVKGLLGQPHERKSNRLYRNLQGQGFQDVTKEAGLDMVFATMGSNFGDFDNDGFLDMYLGTGNPDISMLVPNRMFKNVAGRRFVEITASSGTGNLQKGHGVACGDWDRDGDTDIFIEMGGAMNGDRYHNILFQNPGQGNHSVTLKLIGQKTNRAALGARIKLVTAGDSPQVIYRHVTTGSSFGANPLQQTIGLGSADRIDLLEIQWPTSGTTQVFHDVAGDQAIEITEFADSYRKLNWDPIPLPAATSSAKVTADHR